MTASNIAKVRCGLGALGIFILTGLAVVVVVVLADEFDDDVEEVDEDVDDVDDGGVLFNVELLDVPPPAFSSMNVEFSFETILLFTTIGLATDLFVLAFDPFLRWLRLIPIIGVALF
jgi:hypothetical protein